MSIASELEKLTALRDRGDLSQSEFERAKALLLSGKANEVQPPALPASGRPGQAGKKRRTQLVIAVCATITAALSGASLAINPNPLKGVLLLLWAVVAVAGWISWSRMPKDE